MKWGLSGVGVDFGDGIGVAVDAGVGGERW